MQRVTGIGGIFFTAKDPSALRDWYKRHLDFDMQDWGGTYFTWTDSAGQPTGGSTVWSVMDEKESFGPARRPFMINYRVADLDALLAALRAEGCEVVEKTENSEFGKFGWVIDPEGNNVELWEPAEGF